MRNNLPSVKSKTILLNGGLDLESPSIAVKEGFALEANNVETKLLGGYRRVLGYERVDGRTAPSSQTYYTIDVDDSSSIEVNGSTIVGGTSGAEAVVIAKDDDNNILGVVLLSGSFVEGEDFSGATITQAEEIENHHDNEISVQWRYLAQNYYRSKIQPVAGEGDILGVWQFDGVKYAFRSNGTNVIMYASSSSGWTEVPLYTLLEYDTGTFNEGDIAIGDTIEGDTSGAIAEIKNFVKVSGAYGVDATGYMVIDITNEFTFTEGEDIKKSAVTVMAAKNDSESIKFEIGANRFKFVNFNFHGASNLRMMYGCDCVNRGFQFDGDVLTPIITGMENDRPTNVEAHANHLFFSFEGGSLQHGSPTEPLVFNAITGSAELTVGDEVKSLKSIAGNVLLIATTRTVHALYGNDSTDWDLNVVAIDTGDIGDTLDVIGSPVLTTKRGIVRIDASDVYGNFESSTVSRRINPLLRTLLKSRTVIGTNLIRDKNQYRIYFDDGKGIILTHDSLFGEGSLPAFTTFELTDKPTCLASISIDDAEEVILFGGDNGYVYQEERGTNHDGEAMSYVLRLPRHHLGSPNTRKTFKWVDVEIDTTETTTLRLTYEFSDGQAHTATSRESMYQIKIGNSARWDLVNWDRFYWDSESITKTPTSLNGTGHNISLFFYGHSATDTDFTISSITYQYIIRRLSRG